MHLTGTGKVKKGLGFQLPMAMSVVLKAAPQSLVKSCRRLSQAVVIPPHPIKPAVQAEVTTCILVIPSNQPTLPQDSSNAQLGVPWSIPGIPSPILRSGYHVSVSHPSLHVQYVPPCTPTPPCTPSIIPYHVLHSPPTQPNVRILALVVPMQDASSPTNGGSFPGFQGSSRQFKPGACLT